MNGKVLVLACLAALSFVWGAGARAGNAVVEKVEKDMEQSLSALEKVYLGKVKEVKLKAINVLKLQLNALMLRKDLDGANAVNAKIKELEASLNEVPPAKPELAAAAPSPVKSGGGGFGAIFGDADSGIFKNMAELEVEKGAGEWKEFKEGEEVCQDSTVAFSEVPGELKGRSFFCLSKKEGSQHYKAFAACAKSGVAYMIIFENHYEKCIKDGWERVGGDDPEKNVNIKTCLLRNKQPRVSFTLCSKKVRKGEKIDFQIPFTLVK